MRREKMCVIETLVCVALVLFKCNNVNEYDFWHLKVLALLPTSRVSSGFLSLSSWPRFYLVRLR